WSGRATSPRASPTRTTGRSGRRCRAPTRRPRSRRLPPGADAGAAPPGPAFASHRGFTSVTAGHRPDVHSRGTRERPPGTTAALRWGPAAGGCALIVVAVLLAPHHARAAAAQDWPPFVLVAGLLLVGLVADGDRLFATGGHVLARLSPNGVLLYAGTAVLVVVVTTLLNFDTSVTFLTPVLVYAARSRGEGEAPLLYGCLLLSNAGSLLLPGSNLTNLIVLGHLHLSGGAFLAHMALPALAAAVVTALVVGALHQRALR